MPRLLPLDFSDFYDLRTKGYLYVDKTEYIYSLLTRGRNYFLSRPRRFGKSLLASTLEEILRGNKELFKGLWIDKTDYDWKEHGVIKLDFSAIKATDVESFEVGLYYLLESVAKKYGLHITLDPYYGKRVDIFLKELTNELYARFSKVALIIDEYDSPILKNLIDMKVAEQVRDAMHSFFSTVKSLDKEIKFVFITGVSSFAKAGLFSGLNNLQVLNLRYVLFFPKAIIQPLI